MSSEQKAMPRERRRRASFAVRHTGPLPLRKVPITE